MERDPKVIRQHIAEHHALELKSDGGQTCYNRLQNLSAQGVRTVAPSRAARHFSSVRVGGQLVNLSGNEHFIEKLGDFMAECLVRFGNEAAPRANPLQDMKDIYDRLKEAESSDTDD